MKNYLNLTILASILYCSFNLALADDYAGGTMHINNTTGKQLTLNFDNPPENPVDTIIPINGKVDAPYTGNNTSINIRKSINDENGLVNCIINIRFIDNSLFTQPSVYGLSDFLFAKLGDISRWNIPRGKLYAIDIENLAEDYSYLPYVCTLDSVNASGGPIIDGSISFFVDLSIIVKHK